jgi:hypothetical protein
VPNLRRAGLVLSLLASSLSAASAEAKPKKASKKAEPAKASSPPFDPQLARFGVVRPENAGMMNLVPARIGLDPGGGIVAKSLTHLRPVKKEPPGLTLVGGDLATLSLRPGTYSIQVTTPIADQPPEYLHGQSRAWVSPLVKVMLSKGEVICLVLEPTIAGSEYDGGWTLSKADTPAACESLTQRVTADEEAPAPAP